MAGLGSLERALRPLDAYSSEPAVLSVGEDFTGLVVAALTAIGRPRTAAASCSGG